MEYLNFWSGFALGCLCIGLIVYSIYLDAENKANKIIGDIYQDINANEKPVIRKIDRYRWGCKGVRHSFVIIGLTPVEAYQNYKST